jgi:hypothetical protein
VSRRKPTEADKYGAIPEIADADVVAAVAGYLDQLGRESRDARLLEAASRLRAALSWSEPERPAEPLSLLEVRRALEAWEDNAEAFQPLSCRVWIAGATRRLQRTLEVLGPGLALVEGVRVLLLAQDKARDKEAPENVRRGLWNAARAARDRVDGMIKGLDGAIYR